MMEAVYVQLCFLKGVLLSVLGAAIRRLNPANLKLFTMKKDVQFLRGVNIVVVVMMFLIWKTLVLLVRGNLWAEWFALDQLKAKIEASGYRRVTFSGGEPLLQGESLCALIRSLKEEEYNIAVETALSVPPLAEMFQWVDEWIVDLKFQSPYYTFFPTIKLSNATYRLVVFAELLDNIDWLSWLVEQLKNYSVNSIELLSYHTLGHAKYQRLKRCFSTFTTPTAEDISRISSALVEAGIKTRYLHI